MATNKKPQWKIDIDKRLKDFSPTYQQAESICIGADHMAKQKGYSRPYYDQRVYEICRKILSKNS